MSVAGFAAVSLIVAAIALIIRGRDVRLVLLGASLAIASIADLESGRMLALPAVVREFVSTFSNEKFVVPICTAMGFAYVLRHTGCEQHLVLLLIAPLRRVKWLLVPGVIVVGFLVNIPVISQTSTAVCLGPVVVPLMRAAGYSFATIGACLLLGASVGGELLNPGAPELLTVFTRTGVSTQRQVSEYLPKLVFVQLAVSAIAAWIMSRWWEREPDAKARESNLPEPDAQARATANPLLARRAPTIQNEPDAQARESNVSEPDAQASVTANSLLARRAPPIHPLKALVPLVPLVLLFLAGPPFNVIHIPQNWLVNRPPEATAAALVGSPAAWVAEHKPDGSYSSRLIGLAMLIGVIVALAVSHGKVRDGAKHFFEGAGYGFANIISLIVTATCFGKAIESAGLAAALGRLIVAAPDLLQPLAALVPLAFAALSGSGMASTQSLYGFFHEPAIQAGYDPTAIGSLVALGSAAGRTMSPVAAVTLMCATLTNTNPFTLVRRVAIPLLLGIVVVIGLRMSGVL